MRDTAPTTDIAQRIQAVRESVIGAGDAADIVFLRKSVSAAVKATTLAAHAAGNMAGTLGTGEALAVAQADEKAARNELHRAQRRIADAGKAALPELATLARELGEASHFLAMAMRDAKQHVGNLGGVQLGELHEAWPAVDASARGLQAIAQSLDQAPAKTTTFTMRFSAGWRW